MAWFSQQLPRSRVSKTHINCPYSNAFICAFIHSVSVFCSVVESPVHLYTWFWWWEKDGEPQTEKYQVLRRIQTQNHTDRCLHFNFGWFKVCIHRTQDGFNHTPAVTYPSYLFLQQYELKVHELVSKHVPSHFDLYILVSSCMLSPLCKCAHTCRLHTRLFSGLGLEKRHSCSLSACFVQPVFI